MPGTQASARAAPPRRFENYILTRAVGSNTGLTNVSDSSFTPCSPAAGGFTDPGLGFSADALSVPLQIGFDFQLDNVTYKQFVVSNHGWLALVDPTTGTFTIAEVLTGNAWQNPTIKATFTSQAVLLAAWFDDSNNVASLASQLTGAGFSATKVSRLQQGLEPQPPIVSNVAFGVRCFRDVRSTKGRRLIVRWSVISNFPNVLVASSVLTYEIVIYENGTIEYRYAAAPQTSIVQTISVFEGATIGIFMPNGTNRFRDFASGLGYRDDARQEYIYGGFTNTAAFSDTAPTGNEEVGLTSPYVINLRPAQNWPGLNKTGSIFTFSPPLKRRKVLPRLAASVIGSRLTLPLQARTGDDRLGTTLSSFDDRKSPLYITTFLPSGSLSGSKSGVIVNYPTTLPRFFGGTGPGTLQRQNLFSGDMLVTGSIVKSAIEPYVNEEPIVSMPAFNEAHRPDQNPGTSSFYTVGSSIPDVGQGFDQPLKSKTQVKLQLPIGTQAQMPGVTSSIYYYNFASKAWEVPQNSTYTLASAGSTPPAGQPGGDWCDPTANFYDSVNPGASTWFAEDARGFGPIGNIVASGSHEHNNTFFNNGYTQTDANFGPLVIYNQNNTTNALSEYYPKSLANNSEYQPTTNETFTLPINAPFLIEKAVIEVPMAMGPGWFQDQTQCWDPVPVFGVFSSFDFGGPALTVALHRVVQLSENNTSIARRDLILTGTITHQADNVKGVALSNFPATDSDFQLRNVGFLSFADRASVVVSPTNNQFTGSVSVECEALVTNGLMLNFKRGFADPADVKNILTNPIVSLQGSFGLTTIAYVSPFGRGGTGFDQAGRSILGREYATFQNLADPSGHTATNPFNVANNTIPANILPVFNQLTMGSQVLATTALPMFSHFKSPYLVMPGDKLVLSISKTRPAIFSRYAGWFSGSNPSTGHDIKLMPGNINITLYGSQVQAGVEYHDTLNQPLGSDQIHDVIGGDPVLDQFEVAYRNEYSGSTSDNVMLGTMLTTTVTNGQLSFVTGSRYRRLSKLGARTVPQLSTSPADLQITPSKAYRLQPWYERVGGVRPSQFTDNAERFWDSLMPSIDACFAADGSAIFLATYGAFGNSEQLDPPVTGSQIGSFGLVTSTTPVGYAWFDYQAPIVTNPVATTGPLINGNWTKAFPFEPRYNAAIRQVDISRGLVATYLFGGSPSAQLIPPTFVRGILFGPVELGTSIERDSPTDPTLIVTPNQVMNRWLADVDLTAKNQFGFYTTSSVGLDDTARGLFGFGDRNTYFKNVNQDASISLLGTGHFADFRDEEGPHPDGVGIVVDNNFYSYSPLIRGWKYGVYSGLPTFSKCYWRLGRFGQFRDMLEQRLHTKYYQSPENGPVDPNFKQGIQPAAVTVKFISPDGRLTDPANTWSSNLSFECTSSFPYFDGVSTNRPPINKQTLNQHVVTLGSDNLNNITL